MRTRLLHELLYDRYVHGREAHLDSLLPFLVRNKHERQLLKRIRQTPEDDTLAEDLIKHVITTNEHATS